MITILILVFSIMTLQSGVMWIQTFGRICCLLL